MRRFLILLLASLAAAGPAWAENSSQKWALDRLAQSPRHQEWVTVQNGGRKVQCFVVYPEVSKPAPAVLLVHEIFGLTPWARSEADEVAAHGCIAIAPDLLSGHAPDGEGTSDFPDQDAAIRAVSRLPDDQVTGDLNAAADYARNLPACNGRLAVAGFCWGGTQAFRFATNRADLRAAFIFYGSGPDPAGIARIHCPIYGFYAGNDSRIGATVPGTINLMKQAGKLFEPVTYPGAGHGFMRAGEDPDGSAANRRARDQAWARWEQLLKGI